MAVGRPTWDVQLGQKDSLTPNATTTMELPGPDSPLTKLKQKFVAKSFTTVEMVALSSSYTIERASCWFFQDLIYNNDSNMDRQYVAKMQFAYPSIGGDVTVVVVDPQSPNSSTRPITATSSSEKICSRRTRHSLAMRVAMHRGVVSCADTLAVAAREGVVAVGGPSWDFLLGRKDSLAPNASATIELPDLDSPIAGLRKMFTAKGFTEAEMVALSSAHNIGRSSCRFFCGRIYNDANIDREYAARLQTACPAVGGNLIVAPLDPWSPDMFDNAYYDNLVEWRGLFQSDHALFSGRATMR
ncbi:cationic peroxidase 1-like [Pyrus x bretschneideri]|uniref:cationic peroxidase 1-like n=1 Tax=Pyrus x bretschneideri TaxID=225117 RepID=UPI00203066BE|nr:cationic peroxidase 1-like [Pyrus x bretschneideri]